MPASLSRACGRIVARPLFVEAGFLRQAADLSDDRDKMAIGWSWICWRFRGTATAMNLQSEHRTLIWAQ
jgi:hypothetical protein